MRQRVPSRSVLFAGYALGGLVLAWLLTGSPLLGMACAGLGCVYSLLCVVAPALMPSVEVDGLPKPPDAVVRWSHRVLGVAGIPLWIAAWQNHVPRVPPGILMPVGIGIAVAIAAELMSEGSQRPSEPS